MKTISAVAALALVGLVACEPVVDPGQVDSPNFANGGSPVTASATGSGSMDNSIRTFSFTALQHLDGTVNGSWQRANHDVPGRSNGRVTCVTFIGGNTAFIGGFAQTGRFSTPPNNGVGWAVVDGGEGEGVNDLATLQFVSLSPVQVNNFCALGLGNPPAFNVFQGNIQVKAP